MKVNHLAKSLTEGWLSSTFSSFGDIESLVLRESNTENYAFINFCSLSSAQKAVSKMNGCVVGGLQLQVKLQEPQKGRSLSQNVVHSEPLAAAMSAVGEEMRKTNATTDDTVEQSHQSKTLQQYTLKVTNISAKTSEDELQAQFCCYKGFMGLKIVSGSPRYAWVNYSDLRGAKEAELAANDRELDWCKIKVHLRGEYSTSPQASKPSSKATNTSPLDQAVVTHPSCPVKPFFAVPSATQPKGMSSIFSSHYPGITLQPPKPPAEGTSFNLQHLGESDDKPTPSEPPSSVTKKPCLAAAHGIPLQDPASNPKIYAQSVTNAVTVVAEEKRTSLNVSHEANQNPFTHTLTKNPSSLKTKPTLTTSARSLQMYPNALDTSTTMGSKKDTKVPKLNTSSMATTSDRPQTSTETANQNRVLPAKRYPSGQMKAPISNSSVKANTQMGPENPFLQAHRSFKVVESWPILVHSEKGESQKHRAYKRTLQKSLKCPNPLVAKILTSHPRFKSEVEKITKAFGVSLDTVGNDCITISGSLESVKQAERGMSTLTHQIHQNVTEKSFPLRLLYVPLFANPKTVESICGIETKHCIEVTVIPQTESSTPVSIEDFSMSVRSLDAASLQVTKLSEFVNTSSEFVWYALDDHAEFKPLHLDLNNLLNKLYTPSEERNLLFESQKYVADFSTMVLMERSTGIQRKMHREPPVWYYYKSDEFGFVPHEKVESEAIECLFQDGGPTLLEVEGKQCLIDFDKMLEIDLETGSKMLIRRNPPLNEATCFRERNITLRASGLKESLDPAIADLEAMLDRRIVSVSYDPEFPSHEAHALALQNLLLNTARQYFVRAEIVQEGSVKQIQIQGAGEYVEKVKVCVMEQSLLFQKKLLKFQQLPNFPDEWEPQEEPSELKLVLKGSVEWERVQDLVRRSIAVAEIKKLERIQVIPLWEKYAFFKQQMHVKNKGETNEKLLFHGTRSTSPHDIIKAEKGFDFRFGGNCMWGPAAYFAVNASYSDSYAHKTEGPFKQFLLARVLTGHSKELPPNPNLRKPPSKEEGSGDYDTVTGHTNGSQVYMVYDHEKAYPAYLITYSTH